MSAPVSVSSFHDDAPKDYRQVSLIAVKQRFEDKCYDEISQEAVCPPSPLGLRGSGGRGMPAGDGVLHSGLPTGTELCRAVRCTRSEAGEPRASVFPQHRGDPHLLQLTLREEKQTVSLPCPCATVPWLAVSCVKSEFPP